MAEIFDMVTVKNTGQLAKVIGKRELFGKIDYELELLSGKRVTLPSHQIEE